jgi:signal transduction histidine kinase
LTDLEARIEETNAVVRVEPLPEIDCDRSQMQQVFQNLIANALKFQPEGRRPEITLSSEVVKPEDEETGPQVVLRFRDNGIGFEEKYLDRIFTPFQRLHGRNEYEGTGIGLAVCRKIVERHRGTITAQSAPAEGTTFILRLPVRQETPDAA